MTEENPIIARYMKRFEEALQVHKLREWRDIAADVRSHISEALGYGKPLDEVLASLGPADALARSYAVELTMNPPASGANLIMRWLNVAMLLAAGSFLSFIVVTFLGSLAFGFTISGIMVIIICAIEAVGVHLPNVELAGMHPLLAILIGPPLLAIGLGAGWLLWMYARSAVRVVRRALPTRA